MWAQICLFVNELSVLTGLLSIKHVLKRAKTAR